MASADRLPSTYLRFFCPTGCSLALPVECVQLRGREIIRPGCPYCALPMAVVMRDPRPVQ